MRAPKGRGSGWDRTRRPNATVSPVGNNGVTSATHAADAPLSMFQTELKTLTGAEGTAEIQAYDALSGITQNEMQRRKIWFDASDALNVSGRNQAPVELSKSQTCFAPIQSCVPRRLLAAMACQVY